MIVVSSKPGRLGNLLLVYASFLAWAFEHNRKIVNPSFNRYSGYFTGTLHRLPLLNKVVYHLAYYSARLIDRLRLSNALFGAKHMQWDEKTDLDTGALALPSTPIYFVQGWQYRAKSLVQKHRGRLRDFFTPQPIFTKQLDHFWQTSIPPGDIIVGVHIRRGDYKTFEQGAYYFEPVDYEDIMKKMRVLLGADQITFLLCSDDPGSVLHFQQTTLKTVIAPGHELLDMYALTRCHYILGPPSTYSIWASFYGNVPLYMIRDAKRDFSLEDFHLQTSF